MNEEITCCINDFHSTKMSEIANYIVKSNLKEFELGISFVEETFQHNIKFEYNQTHLYDEETIQFIVQCYNTHERLEMCYLRDFYSKTLLNNYLSSDELKDVCLLGINNGTCIVVHDEDYKIMDLIWIVGSQTMQRIVKNKDTERYFKSIEAFANNDKDCLEFDDIITYKITNDGNHLIDGELQIVYAMRGSTLMLESDTNFVLYNEKWEEVSFAHDGTYLIVKTDYETPKKLYYNKGDKYHYIKLKDGISDLFTNFFTYIQKENDKKVRDYIPLILSSITIPIEVDDQSLMLTLLSEFYKIYSLDMDNDYKAINFVEYACCGRQEVVSIIKNILKSLKSDNYVEFDYYLEELTKRRSSFKSYHKHIDVHQTIYKVDELFLKLNYNTFQKHDKEKFDQLYTEFLHTKLQYNNLIENIKSSYVSYIDDDWIDINTLIKKIKCGINTSLWKGELEKNIYDSHKKNINQFINYSDQCETYFHQIMHELSFLLILYKPDYVHIPSEIQYYRKMDLIKSKMNTNLLKHIKKMYYEEKMDEDKLFEIENLLYKDIEPLNLIKKLSKFSKVTDRIEYKVLLKLTETLYYNGIQKSWLYRKINFYLTEIDIDEEYSIQNFKTLDVYNLKLIKSDIDSYYVSYHIDEFLSDWIEMLIIEVFQHVVDLSNESDTLDVPKDLKSLTSQLIIKKTLYYMDRSKQQDPDGFGHHLIDHYDYLDNEHLVFQNYKHSNAKMSSIKLPKVNLSGFKKGLSNTLSNVKKSISKIKTPKIFKKSTLINKKNAATQKIKGYFNKINPFKKSDKPGFFNNLKSKIKSIVPKKKTIPKSVIEANKLKVAEEMNEQPAQTIEEAVLQTTLEEQQENPFETYDYTRDNPVDRFDDEKKDGLMEDVLKDIPELKEEVVKGPDSLDLTKLTDEQFLDLLQENSSSFKSLEKFINDVTSY